jgi:hypothetical protein
MTKQASIMTVILLFFLFQSQAIAAKDQALDNSVVLKKIDSLSVQVKSLKDKSDLIQEALNQIRVVATQKPDSTFFLAKMSSVYESINALNNKLTKEKLASSKQIRNLQTIQTEMLESQKHESELNLHRIQFIELSLKSISDSLGLQLGDLSDSLEYARSYTVEELNEINTDLSVRNLYWSIAGLFIVILIIVVFLTLRFKVADQRKVLGEEIEKTRKKLQEESIKVDSDLLRLFESQLVTEKESRGNEETVNHDLPLKLADEIHKMRKRLATMDENHNVKVLNKRIESLEDTINAMDYTIKILEGTPYDEGMNLEARFIPDESLSEEEQIITRVIRPQVNYKDKMIQSAQVEVSQGS